MITTVHQPVHYLGRWDVAIETKNGRFSHKDVFSFISFREAQRFLERCRDECGDKVVEEVEQ
jgi:hypothetical protein